MTDHPRTAPRPTAGSGRVPWFIPLFNPILHALLRRGVHLGPNAMFTIPGRRTGEPRQVALAIIDVGGRRWVWSPFGETQWVRNLRAAGGADIAFQRRTERVTVRELPGDERLSFFRETLPAVAGATPGGRLFVKLIDGTDLNDPEAAAEGRPVFELLTA